MCTGILSKDYHHLLDDGVFLWTSMEVCYDVVFALRKLQLYMVQCKSGHKGIQKVLYSMLKCAVTKVV